MAGLNSACRNGVGRFQTGHQFTGREYCSWNLPSVDSATYFDIVSAAPKIVSSDLGKEEVTRQVTAGVSCAITGAARATAPAATPPTDALVRKERRSMQSSVVGPVRLRRAAMAVLESTLITLPQVGNPEHSVGIPLLLGLRTDALDAASTGSESAPVLGDPALLADDIEFAPRRHVLYISRRQREVHPRITSRGLTPRLPRKCLNERSSSCAYGGKTRQLAPTGFPRTGSATQFRSLNQAYAADPATVHP